MNDGDLNEELEDGIQNTILEVQMSLRESGESFIFGTIKPFCEEVLSREISKKELKEMLLKAERMKWIPCSERMPEERDSIFARWKGTDKWEKAMPEKISATVIATVEYSNGERMAAPARTIDGKWRCDCIIGDNGKVIAWSPLPEPYKE